jgi:hypothetical protein
VVRKMRSLEFLMVTGVKRNSSLYRQEHLHKTRPQLTTGHSSCKFIIL